MRVRLTQKQIEALIEESLTSDNTIKRVYKGAPSRPLTYRRVVRGAKALGLPLPPPINDASHRKAA